MNCIMVGRLGIFVGLQVFWLTAVCAATRTVCLDIVIKDERVDCPTGGTGVRRPCDTGDAVTAAGMEVALWDKDAGNGSGDEYIGLWSMTTGLTCMTFEWEGASYSLGETHPDVYFEVRNRVWASGSNESIRIVDDGGTIYGYPTSREGWGGDPDAGTAVECTTAGSCYIAGGGGVYVTNNAASNYGQALQALDSAQRVLSIYHTRLNNGTISIEVPDSSGACPTACAPSRNEIIIPAGLAEEGFRTAHEMGHILHMSEFGQDVLRTDYSAGGGGWTLTSQENDSAAVAEGFATYVAAVAWWDPNNSGSDPEGFGENYETAAPEYGACASNRGVALQVARAFWDLDDTNNEAGAGAAAGEDDSTSMSSLSITAGWANFAVGTANRENYETGVHGVNAYDFDFNLNVNDETFFDHNCIGSQQP